MHLPNVGEKFDCICLRLDIQYTWGRCTMGKMGRGPPKFWLVEP